MDGLALLCTLHARGPTTLERLRGAGVRTLDELPNLREEELSRVLGCSTGAARRFASEACLLARRLGAGATDRVGERRPSATRPAPAGSPTPPPNSLRWGAEPEVELRPAQRPEPSTAWPLHARPERSGLRAPEPRRESPQGVTASSPPPGASSEFLRPGDLPGLTTELCRALEQAGVRTAAELARMADLALARRIGLSFPKLLDLAHSARVLSSAAPTGAGHPARGADASRRVSVGPPSEQEVGVGGPFT